MSHSDTFTETAASLRDLHPLYRRVGGEAAWLLMEEAGLKGQELERAMDEFIETREASLEHMRILRAEPSRRVEIRSVSATSGEAAPLCTACRSCVGMILSREDRDWMDLFPPYAVGCLLRAEYTEKAASLSADMRPARPLCPPLCPLRWPE